MGQSESPNHLRLKQLALEWAQQHGFRVAAVEVSVPELGCRVDVAAYRAETRSVFDQTSGRKRRVTQIGATAIFECKQARADLLTDSRRTAAIGERLRKLHTSRAR